MHHRWTLRPLDLGRTAVELLKPPSNKLALEVYDGGGVCPSHGIWRVGGKLVAIVEAGQG